MRRSINQNTKCFTGGSDSEESPAMRGTWVQSLGWEDPLAGSMATHSSILAGESSLTEEPGRLHTVHGVAKRAGHDWVTKHSTRH